MSRVGSYVVVRESWQLVKDREARIHCHGIMGHFFFFLFFSGNDRAALSHSGAGRQFRFIDVAPRRAAISRLDDPADPYIVCDKTTRQV